MAGDDIPVVIDQDRDVEAESFNAVGDLPELLFAVAPRIGRIRIELFDATVANRESIVTPRSSSAMRRLFEMATRWV
jgi:hypothetical protein